MRYNPAKIIGKVINMKNRILFISILVGFLTTTLHAGDMHSKRLKKKKASIDNAVELSPLMPIPTHRASSQGYSSSSSNSLTHEQAALKIAQEELKKARQDLEKAKNKLNFYRKMSAPSTLEQFGANNRIWQLIDPNILERLPDLNSEQIRHLQIRALTLLAAFEALTTVLTHDNVEAFSENPKLYPLFSQSDYDIFGLSYIQAYSAANIAGAAILKSAQSSVPEDLLNTYLDTAKEFRKSGKEVVLAEICKAILPSWDDLTKNVEKAVQSQLMLINPSSLQVRVALMLLFTDINFICLLFQPLVLRKLTVTFLLKNLNK